MKKFNSTNLLMFCLVIILCTSPSVSASASDKASFLSAPKSNTLNSKPDILWLNKNYDTNDYFSDGLCPFFTNQKSGFINAKGKVVIKPKYDEAYCYHEGLAAVELNNKWGYIDKKGKVVVPIKYTRSFDDETSFSEDLAVVQLNGKYGFVNKNGKVVIPFKYDNASSFFEGMAAVEKNNKWGYINLKGKTVIPFTYDIVGDFSENLAYVYKNNNYMYINKSGKIVISLKKYYKKQIICKGFKDGRAAIKLNHRWGFIDKKGKTVIPIKYYCDESSDHLIDDFSNRIVEVGLVTGYDKETKDTLYKEIYLDRNGKRIDKFDKYTNIYTDCLNEKFIPASLKDKWGYIDKNGKEIIPFEFDNVSPFDSSVAIVHKDLRVGILKAPLKK